MKIKDVVELLNYERCVKLNEALLSDEAQEQIAKSIAKKYELQEITSCLTHFIYELVEDDEGNISPRTKTELEIFFANLLMALRDLDINFNGSRLINDFHTYLERLEGLYTHDTEDIAFCGFDNGPFDTGFLNVEMEDSHMIFTVSFNY